MASRLLIPLALALPLVNSAALARPASTQPCKSAAFTLEMLVNSNWQSLNALSNFADESVLSIVAEPLNEYLGTPVLANDTNPDEVQLTFHLDGHNQNLTTGSGMYGMFVGDVGDVEGLALPVIAQKRSHYDGFSINNGTVFNRMTDADQDWYACNVTLNGAQYTTLSWGLMNLNGSYPFGCTPTAVRQNFNLDCGDS